MIFVGCTAISDKLNVSYLERNRSREMTEGNASYRARAVSRRQPPANDRLAPGPAVLAAFGLSLLCWAVILIPLAAMFHR